MSEPRINILSIATAQLIELMEANGLDPTISNQYKVVREFNERFDWHNGADELLDAIDEVKKEVNK
jgi:hypothetical protein